MNSPLDLLASAMAAAQRATTFLRAVERPAPDRWSAKGRSDFVTEVDREAERLIREELSRRPGMKIVGEELSPSETPSGWHWVVDPLDGTTNFLHGDPAHAVSIAAVHGARAEVGVIQRPGDGVVWQAVRGQGAWRGDVRLQVSAIQDPALALIGTGFPFKHPKLLPAYLQQFEAILPASSGIRRGGSAALDLVAVAEGRFDGFWELSLAPWDVAAGIVLVEEAGGVVSTPGGAVHRLESGGIVAGNAAVHRWLLATLDRVGAGAP